MQRQSTLLILGRGGGSTINVETIDTVDPGGQINNQHREDQQSTFTFAVKR